MRNRFNSFGFSFPEGSHKLWIGRWNCMFNSSSREQNGRYFTDDVFECNFLNKKISISIRISMKFVLKVPTDNNSALVQEMARRQAITWTNADPVDGH